jgi:superkiller protein 3
MSPEEQFNEAVRLEAEGQTEAALVMWRELSKIHPARNGFLRLARITRKLGLLDEAQRAFEQALQIDPGSGLALKGLGVLAIGRRDFVAAADYLQRACAIEEDASTLSMLGVALHNTGRDEEAEAAYRKAIDLDPTYEEAYFNLGVVLRDDRPGEAQENFRIALALDSEMACAHREMGFVLAQEREWQKAEVELRKAIELDPADIWAHIYLGSCLLGLSHRDGAMAEFEIAAKLDPAMPLPLWSLGKIYERGGAVHVARGYFERALALDPKDEEALAGLARFSNLRAKP